MSTSPLTETLAMVEMPRPFFTVKSKVVVSAMVIRYVSVRPLVECFTMLLIPPWPSAAAVSQFSRICPVSFFAALSCSRTKRSAAFICSAAISSDIALSAISHPSSTSVSFSGAGGADSTCTTSSMACILPSILSQFSRPAT